jgi:hypothetical protein
MANEEKTKWELSIPWFTTTVSFIMLIVLGIFLVRNIEWFKTSVFASEIIERNDPEYRFYAYHMHLSMIKRSVGLFTGFAIMFIGMGVIFFTIKEKIEGQLTAPSFSANLVTASPGLIALIMGGYLIIASIQSKDDFPAFERLHKSRGMLQLPSESRKDDVKKNTE